MYILYGSDGCHLCEQAYQMLSELGLAQQVTQVDIVEQAELVARYGERIPVLLRQDERIELNWPFTAVQLTEFFSSNLK